MGGCGRYIVRISVGVNADVDVDVYSDVRVCHMNQMFTPIVYLIKMFALNGYSFPALYSTCSCVCSQGPERPFTHI